MSGDIVSIATGFLQGFLSSTVFVLVLFIGFCVLLGYVKLKRTAGRDLVIKSLDERLDHKPVVYLSPAAPRGPADQLRAPELIESKA